LDCKNFEGSEVRQSLFHGEHSHNLAYLQHANAAITGAIGSSGFASAPPPKRRKGQEIFFNQGTKDSSTHRLGQVNHLRKFICLVGFYMISSFVREMRDLIV